MFHINGKLVLCKVHSAPMPCPHCALERRKVRALERHARALERAHTLDAERKRREVEGGREGGRMRRKGPSDDVLCDEMRALHERNPFLSWTEASRKVAQKYGITDKTVRNRVKAHDPAVQDLFTPQQEIRK